jgi:hypothetical protein
MHSLYPRTRPRRGESVLSPEPSLFGEPAPPSQGHSEPSVKAAISMRPKANTLRDRIYQYLTTYGPATDDEIRMGLGLDGNTARPRRIELVAMGKVTAAGKGKSSRGNQATLWMALDSASPPIARQEER